MSFLCETPEPQVQPTTQTVVNEVPAYEQEARKRLYGRSDAIAAEPYTPYTGQRIAPFTADEQNAFAITRGMQGQFQPAVNAAYGMTGAAAQQWPTANLSAYMNPYTQGVTDIAAREAIRNAGLQRKNMNDQFVKSGSFGGYRQGVAEAEMNRNLGMQLDDIYLKGGQAAFTQAGQLFGADRDAALKAGNQFGQLATAEQGLGLRDVAAQQAVGEAQRAQDQKGYDLAYQNFMEQRDYPKSQANWLANIIKGTTQNTQSTTQGQQIIPQASPLSQIAGLGTTALGLYGLGKGVGWFRQGGHVKGYADGGEVEFTSEDIMRALQTPGLDRQTHFALNQELQNRLRSGVVKGPVPGYKPSPSQILRDTAGQIFPDRTHEAGQDLRIPTQRRAETADLAPAPATFTDLASTADPAPLTRAPSNGGAGGQTRANTGGSGGGGGSGSFFDSVRDKIFGPEREHTPLTKPVEVNAPETRMINEDVSPWMAITRAGLGMMAAKPGQSALSAIGEGGLAGVEQFNKDVMRADANKKTNIDNAFKQADFYIKKAMTENDRLVRERQLAQAEKQITLAERGLALQFANGQVDERYKNKMLDIQSRYASAAGNATRTAEDLIRRANPNISDQELAAKVLDYTRDLRTAPRISVLTPAQALSQARKDIEGINTMGWTPERKNAEVRRLAEQYMAKNGGTSREALDEIMRNFLK